MKGGYTVMKGPHTYELMKGLHSDEEIKEWWRNYTVYTLMKGLHIDEGTTHWWRNYTCTDQGTTTLMKELHPDEGTAPWWRNCTMMKRLHNDEGTTQWPSLATWFSMSTISAKSHGLSLQSVQKHSIVHKNNSLLFFKSCTAMYGQLAHMTANIRRTATNVPVLTTGGLTINWNRTEWKWFVNTATCTWKV